MDDFEEFKKSISRLALSDQSDILLHALRLRYNTTLSDIIQISKGTVPEEATTSIDNLSIDKLLERLHLLEGIREGLKDATEKRTIDHDNVKNMFKQWRKKK